MQKDVSSQVIQASKGKGGKGEKGEEEGPHVCGNESFLGISVRGQARSREEGGESEEYTAIMMAIMMMHIRKMFPQKT